MSALGPRLAALAAAALLVALLATGAGASPSATPDSGRCPLLQSTGHTWIVVAKGVACATATRVARRLAPRTASLPKGRTTRVPSPVPGFVCVLRNVVIPTGACVKGRAVQSIIWEAAR